MKTIREKIEKAYYSISTMMWFPCPHCKKMMILIPKEDKGGRMAIRKWRKVKPITKKICLKP
jgi:hypothetical protein